VTVGTGSGTRTVTKLELRASTGVWDTAGATNWALGAVASLDGALLNASNGAVSFGVTDGGVVYLFAADPSSAFATGTSFTLTANFADGTTATATTTVQAVVPPTLSLAFRGKVRDKVGKSSTAFSPDGALDGTFQVTVGAGSGTRTATKLELRASTGGVWDTAGATNWALGAAASLDGALLNASNGAVSFGVTDGSVVYLVAADPGSAFATGTSFTLTANFTDGSAASATATVPVMPTISSVTPSAGAPGASLTMTVTGTNFQAGASAAFGAGITVSSTTVVSSTQLSVAMAIASTAALGPRDVTITNPNGVSVISAGEFTVAAVPPPTLSLAFQGKLRDKVGRGSTAFSPDGALDGTFQVTVGAGSGARTVTKLELRASTGGVWDTAGATNWALGAAASLDGARATGR